MLFQQCSKSCDEGYKTRKVACHAVNAYGWIESDEMDEVKSRRFCGSLRKPKSFEKCNFGNCSSGFVWKPDKWKQVGLNQYSYDYYIEMFF